jgi:radical SAM protein with 4Fe4S-binding SPASM domain
MWFLFPTWSCNLKCAMCFVDGGNVPITEELTIDQWREVILFLNQTNDFVFDIGGGEPLINEKTFQIISYIKSLGGHVTVTSNGFNLDRFLKHLNTGLLVDNIEISLDAPSSQIHDRIRGIDGAFDRSVLNIRKLINLKNNHIFNGQIGISNISLTSNIRLFPNLLKFAEKEGIEYVYAQSLDPVNRARNLVSRVPNPLQYINCIIATIECLVKLNPKNLKVVSFYCPPSFRPFIEKFMPYNWFRITNSDGETISLLVHTAGCNCKMYSPFKAIDPYGNLTGCYLMARLQSAQVANVLELAKAGDTARLYAVLERARERFYTAVISNDAFECRSCQYFDCCKGGCRAVLLETKAVEAKDPRCAKAWFKNVKQNQVNEASKQLSCILKDYSVEAKYSENLPPPFVV